MRSISRTRKLAAAGTLVLVGFGAGATATVMGSASAEDATTPPSATADGSDGPGTDRPGGPRGSETPLTGATLAEVTAAVEAEYPGATIERAETDDGGVYEAHVTTADGERLTVLVDEDFTVTGTETHEGRGPGGKGGPGGPGGPGGDRAPLTGDALAEVTAAVEADYPDATIEHAHAEGDGYEAHVTTADGERLAVRLDADFAVTGSEADTRGPGGPGGPSGDRAPLTGDALAKVTAAVEADYPDATIEHAHAEGEGYEAHVTTADGERLAVRLDADFAVTGSEADTRGPGGPRGPGPRGTAPATPPATPSDSATS